jgi:hypothetical protein
MLAHLDGPQRVVADVWSLDLDERFDVVLALSHLLNDRSRERRMELLRVCRRHVPTGGIVVIQRHLPSSASVPPQQTGFLGPVGVRLHDVVELTDGFSAAVTYALGDRTWTQVFDGAIVDDEELAGLAAAAGFRRWHAPDEDGWWVTLMTT